MQDSGRLSSQTIGNVLDRPGSQRHPGAALLPSQWTLRGLLGGASRGPGGLTSTSMSPALNERVPSEIRHYPNQQSKLEICRLRRLRTIYFFSAILRAISAMSLGRRLARTLSTMLATSAKSLFGAAETSRTICSAPAATALAEAGADSDTSNSLGWTCAPSPSLRISRS